MQILTDKQAIIASFVLILTIMFLVIPLNLLACCIAGFIVYEIINALTPYVERFISGRRARLIVVTLMSIGVISFLFLMLSSLVSFMLHESHNTAALSQRVTLVLQNLQSQLKVFLPWYLPNGVEELKNQIIEWLQQNSSALKKTSTHVLHNFVTVLIGMLLGVIFSLYEMPKADNQPALKKHLIERFSTLVEVFRNILFAQLKISSVNTLLSGIFLLVILPIFNINLPFAHILVILTFIFGLIPVVGNLASNTLIFIAGLTISLPVAGVTLAYLIIIHKLEYFLNASIVGARINANIWEILIAMLLMESIFGIGGLIAAPIYYAYIKRELIKFELI